MRAAPYRAHSPRRASATAAWTSTPSLATVVSLRAASPGTWVASLALPHRALEGLLAAPQPLRSRARLRAPRARPEAKGPCRRRPSPGRALLTFGSVTGSQGVYSVLEVFLPIWSLLLLLFRCKLLVGSLSPRLWPGDEADMLCAFPHLRVCLVRAIPL